VRAIFQYHYWLLRLAFLISKISIAYVEDFAVSHVESSESEIHSVHRTELTDYYYYVDMDRWQLVCDDVAFRCRRCHVHALIILYVEIFHV
jgi:hypothetical protein